MLATGIAEGADPAKKGAEKKKIVFSAEVEPKFVEFIDKVAEAKRGLWLARTEKEIDEVVKVTKLNADGVKALKQAAEHSVELCLPAWKIKMDETWRQNYSRQSDQSMIQILGQITGQADDYAKFDWFGDYVPPTDHSSWTDAIRQTLTTEQLAAWEKESGDRKEKLKKEITDFLKPLVARNQEAFKNPILILSADLKITLGLPKKTVDQLDTLAGTLAEKGAENWRKRAEQVLLNAEEVRRRQIIKDGNMYMGRSEGDMAEQRVAWSEGVQKILSAEEFKRLQGVREERRALRIRAVGQIMIAELDQKIAFTANQRQRLQPIVERLVADDTTLVPDEGSDFGYGYQLRSFYSAGAEADESEIKAVLDPVQWKHWQEVCTQRGTDSSPSRMAAGMANAGGNETKALQRSEDEAIENAVSEYLHNRAASERKRLLGTMILKAEDAARVANLAPATVDRLQTAARGSAELSLASWKSGMETNIRSYINNVTSENVRQRLANIQDYQLQRGMVTRPEEQKIWEKTLKSELTDAQRSSWQAEVQERNDYRDKAIAAALMDQFNRKTQLTKAQREKLEPMLAGVMKEYGADIGGMFSYNNQNPWYLQQYSMFVPFGGIPEKDIKDLLTKEQWESWTGCNEFANVTNYWENVKRMHDQRTKENK